MDDANLVHMANQIGAYFAAYPDRALAAREIANHLSKFWAPRMRIALLRYVELHGGVGLAPATLAAIRTHRTLLDPRGRAAPPAAQ